MDEEKDKKQLLAQFLDSYPDDMDILDVDDLLDILLIDREFGLFAGEREKE